MTLPENPWQPVGPSDTDEMWRDELDWLDGDTWTEDAAWSDE